MKTEYDNTVTMTASEIMNRFHDVNVLETCLCDLADSEFVTGGRVTDIVHELGYDESGRLFVNCQDAWHMSIYDWAHTVGI